MTRRHYNRRRRCPRRERTVQVDAAGPAAVMIRAANEWPDHGTGTYGVFDDDRRPAVTAAAAAATVATVAAILRGRRRW